MIFERIVEPRSISEPKIFTPHVYRDPSNTNLKQESNFDLWGNVKKFGNKIKELRTRFLPKKIESSKLETPKPETLPSIDLESSDRLGSESTPNILDKNLKNLRNSFDKDNINKNKAQKTIQELSNKFKDFSTPQKILFLSLLTASGLMAWKAAPLLIPHIIGHMSFINGTYAIANSAAGGAGTFGTYNYLATLGYQGILGTASEVLAVKTLAAMNGVMLMSGATIATILAKKIRGVKKTLIERSISGPDLQGEDTFYNFNEEPGDYWGGVKPRSTNSVQNPVNVPVNVKPKRILPNIVPKSSNPENPEKNTDVDKTIRLVLKGNKKSIESEVNKPVTVVPKQLELDLFGQGEKDSGTKIERGDFATIFKNKSKINSSINPNTYPEQLPDLDQDQKKEFSKLFDDLDTNKNQQNFTKLFIENSNKPVVNFYIESFKHRLLNNLEFVNILNRSNITSQDFLKVNTVKDLAYCLQQVGSYDKVSLIIGKVLAKMSKDNKTN